MKKITYYGTTLLFALIALLYIFVLITVYNKDFLHVQSGIGFNMKAVHNYVGYCVGIGAYVAYVLLLLPFPKVRHNLRWFMRFTHELTHTFHAILFFAKIHEFIVKERRCYVYYEANRLGYVPITLSPYCIPIYTFMLLPFRFFGDNSYMFVFDILIAFTYAFHVHSFMKYTRPSQDDIQGCGLALSTSYLAATHLIILSLLLATPAGGVMKALLRVFWEYPYDIIRDLITFF